MLFVAFAAVVGVGCLLALGFGAASQVQSMRAAAFARYPLVLVSWLIATPFFALSAFGAVMALSVTQGGGSPDVWIGGGLCVTAAVACVVAVLMCSRAARGKYERGPLVPAILGFGAPLLPVVLGGLNGSGGFVTIVGLSVAAGAGVNGLLAVRVNGARRASTYDVPPSLTGSPLS